MSPGEDQNIVAVLVLPENYFLSRYFMEQIMKTAHHCSSSEPESIAKIKRLYEDLCLPNTYALYEEESFNIIKTHIQQISKGMRHDLFFNIMEKLYKRECWSMTILLHFYTVKYVEIFLSLCWQRKRFSGAVPKTKIVYYRFDFFEPQHDI